jgi:branched-chain amino acid transport system substrate-binding protein
MKTTFMKMVVGLTFISFLATACAGVANPTIAPTGTGSLPAEIILGAVHDLSGATANYGMSIQKGINLAVKQINDQKFLGEGHVVKVIFEDSAGDSKQAVAAFEKLIANTSIVAILGPTLSTEALVADPIAQKAGMPVVASSNTVDGIVDIGDYIFRTSAPESVVIPNTVKVTAKALNLKQVALMYGKDDAYTRGGYQVFKESLNNAGIKILTEETFSIGDKDFSTQLTKIKSLNPDAILVSALAEEAANIMVGARSLGIPESIHIIGGNGFNSAKLAQIAGKSAEGAISGSAWNVDSTFQASADFVKAFTVVYNTAPDQFAAQAYVAAWVVAVAVKNANSTGHAAVRDALAQVKDFDTPLGKYAFDAKRNPVHEPVVLIVKDGKFVVFQP